MHLPMPLPTTMQSRSRQTPVVMTTGYRLRTWLQARGARHRFEVIHDVGADDGLTRRRRALQNPGLIGVEAEPLARRRRWIPGAGLPIDDDFDARPLARLDDP